MGKAKKEEKKEVDKTPKPKKLEPKSLLKNKAPAKRKVVPKKPQPNLKKGADKKVEVRERSYVQERGTKEFAPPPPMKKKQ